MLPATKLSSLTEAAALDDDALIRLIMQYHDAHVRDLNEAIELAEQVSCAHAGSSAFPGRLLWELRDMLSELMVHQGREEAVIFPAILEGRRTEITASAMSADHDDAQHRLERLVRLTEDYAAPAEACDSWRRLYVLCRRFDQQLRAHLQLEERVLFARLLKRNFSPFPKLVPAQSCSTNEEIDFESKAKTIPL